MMASLSRKATPIWSKVSARYIGLRVKRYGPPRTIVVVGSDGLTFVPAAFISRNAEIARIGAIMKHAMPMRIEIARGKNDIGIPMTKKCASKLTTTVTAQINGGNANTLG